MNLSNYRQNDVNVPLSSNHESLYTVNYFIYKDFFIVTITLSQTVNYNLFSSLDSGERRRQQSQRPEDGHHQDRHQSRKERNQGLSIV